MATKIGPRLVVKFGKVATYKSTGQGKSTKVLTDQYAAIRKATCDYFGIAGEAVVTKKGKGGRVYPVRGQRGAKHVLLPQPTRKGKDGQPKLARVPVPAGATIAQTQDFLKRVIKKNKPKTFYSPDGRSYATGM